MGEKWSESGAVGLKPPVGLNELLLRRPTEARQEIYFLKTLNHLFATIERCKEGDTVFTDEVNSFEITSLF